MQILGSVDYCGARFMNAKAAKPRRAKRRAAHPTPKPRPRKAREDALAFTAEQIQLVRTKGTAERGGGPGGEAWRIDADGKRAGVIFINQIDEPPVGPHASIQIYLNVPHQGRMIGRVAYRKACEASAYDTIYAHMRKSNVASRRAAEEAGFKDVTSPAGSQLLMMRRRSTG
jgi:RimJ/RimL family protein N-acetyltransferase